MIMIASLTVKTGFMKEQFGYSAKQFPLMFRFTQFHFVASKVSL